MFFNIIDFFMHDLYSILVYGALIGKQDGRKIEVFNSFELKYETIEDDVVINKDYYNTKEEQCKINIHKPQNPEFES